MFPRYLNQNPIICLKLIKKFSTTKRDLHVESSPGVSKVPILTSCVLEEVIDLDASSLDNT
jgi:hypothetical protein